MAKLAAVVDSLDAVPEPLRENYIQAEGGKFVLDADVDAHPAIVGLKKKNQELIGREKDLSGKLRPFEGLDPEQVTKAIDAQRKAEEERQKQEGNFETLKQQMAQQLATKEKEWQAKESRYQTAIERRVARDEARAALAAVEGNATLLMPHILETVRTVEEGDDWNAIVVDKKGNQRFNPTTGDPMTIKELVAEMMTKDEYKPAFPAPSVTGSGAPSTQRRSGSGDIVLSKEQQKDPGAYRRAKEEALKRGVSVVFAQ